MRRHDFVFQKQDVPVEATSSRRFFDARNLLYAFGFRNGPDVFYWHWKFFPDGVCRIYLLRRLHVDDDEVPLDGMDGEVRGGDEEYPD